MVDGEPAGGPRSKRQQFSDHVTVDIEPRDTDIPSMDTTVAAYSGEASEKSRGVALALVTLLGVFGGHRFYVGKTGTGILQAATLGGAGLWWLYDLILVASGSFRDANNRLVRRWDPEEAAAAGTLPSEVMEELDVLRSQVAELAERVDFTERLLASGRTERDSVRPGVPS
jgi:TM2 domain-containing membrane protein YozV